MKFWMIITSLMTTFAGSAQQTINVDDPNNRSLVNLAGINGEPVNMVKYMRIVEGSIFIPAEFTSATILIKNNKNLINSVKARINIVEHTLHYLDDKGNEYFTRLPVEEIFFKDPSTEDTHIFTQMPESCTHNNSGWFEVLEKGKLILYREIIKTVSENKPYGSATTEQKVHTSYKYHMNVGSGCRQVNKINDFIVELKKINPGIEPVITGQKYSDKKVEDWIAVARNFNALQ